MASDFSDVKYWDARFLKEEKPFEWLKHPDEIVPYVQSILDLIPEPDRRILHFGPGSSTLSLALRNLVSEPSQIHNIDYSQNAIDRGALMERKAFDKDTDELMQWTCADLLKLHDIRRLVHADLFEPQYPLVVDKCATDAVACGPDVTVKSQLYRTTLTDVQVESDIAGHAPSEVKLHPVACLALHMAVLTASNARWMCFSYSRDRFSFIMEEAEQCKPAPRLDPRKYWTIETVEPVAVKSLEGDAEDTSSPVHRPKISYWLYVLRRTSEGVALVSNM